MPLQILDWGHNRLDDTARWPRKIAQGAMTSKLTTIYNVQQRNQTYAQGSG
jgi:hypothetical protein